MPPTTASEFGSVLLVPFPFSDQSASKKRPAVVVSSDTYHRSHADFIVAAVTSQTNRAPDLGDVAVLKWRQAGLLKPSLVKGALLTISRSIVIRKLGTLEAADRSELRSRLKQWIG